MVTTLLRFIGLAVLYIAIGLPLAPSAFCADPDWFLLDESQDSSFFYDRSGTTKPKEGVVRVRTRVVYTEQGKAEAVKALGAVPEAAKLYESRYIYDIDCAEREARLLAASHFDKSGGILKTVDLSAFTDWEYLPPMTRMAVVANETCGR